MKTYVHGTTQTGINPVEQTKAHESRSDKYQFIGTDTVEQVFFDHGFRLESRSYGTPRLEARRGFQKHVSIFTRDDLVIGDSHMQLLLTNAHDGTSSFGLDVGVYREVCANGLVSGETDTSIRIRHSKNALPKIDKAIEYLTWRMPQVAANVDLMRNIKVSPRDYGDLIKIGFELRLGHLPELYSLPKVRRDADAGEDLWSIFNLLQEYVIKGGLHWYCTKDSKWKKTRKITAVDKTTKLNKQLWNAAMLVAA